MILKTPFKNSANASRIVPGLLLIIVYFSSLALPLLHHIEIGRACQQRLPVAGVVLQAQELVFTHNKDLCAICQNSYFNHYFQFFRPLLFSGPAPLYREPVLSTVSRVQARHEHIGQPRAPPQI